MISTNQPESHRGRRRFIRTLGVLGSVLSLIFATTAPAWASSLQGERNTSTSINWDGSFATVSGDAYMPGANRCQAYAVVVASKAGQPEAQLLVGELKCGQGGSVDGTCNGSQLVTEYHPSPGNYYCYEEAGYTQGDTHNLKVVRSATSPGCFTAFIDGTGKRSGCNLLYSDQILLGEQTAVSGCSGWDGSGTFRNWQVYDFMDGWSDTTGAGGPAAYTQGCWRIGAIVNKVSSIGHI